MRLLSILLVIAACGDDGSSAGPDAAAAERWTATGSLDTHSCTTEPEATLDLVVENADAAPEVVGYDGFSCEVDELSNWCGADGLQPGRGLYCDDGAGASLVIEFCLETGAGRATIPLGSGVSSCTATYDVTVEVEDA